MSKKQDSSNIKGKAAAAARRAANKAKFDQKRAAAQEIADREGISVTQAEKSMRRGGFQARPA